MRYIFVEQRKIVKSGNTSFTIALPIEWIRKNKLDRGSVVNVGETEEGDLAISGESKPTQMQESIVTIMIDGKDDGIVDAELSNAYIRDFPTIIVQGKELRTKTQRILNQLKTYIGLDVIEQTSEMLMLKNFFVITRETSPYTLIKKMGLANQAILGLLQPFFSRGFTKDDFSEIQRLKDHNERLFVLIRKSILKLLEHPFLMKTIQTSHLELSKDKVIALCFRNISVALAGIGNAFLFLENKKSEIVPLKEALQKIQRNHESILSFMANKNYPLIFEFVRLCRVENEKWERALREIRNPLIAECINTIINSNHILQDVAEQYVE